MGEGRGRWRGRSGRGPLLGKQVYKIQENEDADTEGNIFPSENKKC